MPIRWNPREHLSLGFYVIKWLLILLPVAGVIGSACALFLWSLDEVTRLRLEHPWFLFLLPVAGLLIGALYHWFGKPVEGGNDLIVEQIHEPGGGVPSRMAPLVLIGTLVTHLFGGSAGREGTAVQMGGSIASTFSRRFSIQNGDGRTLLMAGIAAGFGAVFGTPLTGAIFALEVIAVGKMSYQALIPCLIASIVGDWSCAAWGVGHTRYRIELIEAPHLNVMLLGKVALASMAFGLASLFFAELAHGLQYVFKKAIPSTIFRPAVGGILVIALVYVVGTRDFLGIGVTSPDPHAVTILSSFHDGGAFPWSWFWKIVFTCVTIGSGFKGGEVTPLFFVGAALGNVLGAMLGAPVDLFAGLGFVAVFAGAANTPLACTIMGVELFGSGYVVYFAVACFLAYLFSGHTGIYLSQKVGAPKLGSHGLPADPSLRSVRQLQPSIYKWLVALFERKE
jgi:H+/Cl- antiporter ClcA